MIHLALTEQSISKTIETMRSKSLVLGFMCLVQGFQGTWKSITKWHKNQNKPNDLKKFRREYFSNLFYYIVSFDKMKLEGSIDCLQGAVRAVRYNVDGDYILTCGSNKTVKLWNAKTRVSILHFSN